MDRFASPSRQRSSRIGADDGGLRANGCLVSRLGFRLCDMALMALCVVLAAAGVAAIGVWGGLSIVSPAATVGGTVGAAVHRFLWWANLVVCAGLIAGVLAAGAGGRLIMRLLAATSPDARGLLTEADETVGKITLDGTLGFLVFGALPAAMVAAFLFAVIFRWLPRGRLNGLAFGLLLLIVASTRLEPLRANNPDFRLLGPAWLAAGSFALLVLADGLLTAAFMGWYSRRLPLPGRGRRLWYYLAPVVLLLLVAVIGVPILVLIAVGAGVVAIAARVAPEFGRWWSARRMTMVGRTLLGVASLLAMPGFVTAINDIVP